MMKEVSVIIPAYNCGRYLEDAISSVISQNINLEIILIDDASTDGTEGIVKMLSETSRYPIHYIRNDKNIGVSASRNKGISRANGKYIAFLDADDWWESDKLKKQLLLIREKGAVLCYTGRELFSESGEKTGKIISVPMTVHFKKLLYTNMIPCSSVLLKTEIAKEFPMEHDEVHEDYLTWLRIVEKYGKAYGINEPLLKSRLTAGGKSRDKTKTIKMTYGVYRYIGISRCRACYYTVSHLLRSVLRYAGRNR